MLHAGDLRFEAEDGDVRAAEVEDDLAGFAGTGYVTGITNDDSSVTFRFPASAGLYDLYLRNAAPLFKRATVSVNGRVFDADLPRTDAGAFDEVFAGSVRLREGTNEVRVAKGWGYYDLDGIRLGDHAPIKAASVPPGLSDPKATASAIRLYDRPRGIYGLKTLSGQYSLKDFREVKRRTGKATAILGEDLIKYTPSRREHGDDPEGATERWIDFVEDSGAILTVCWHRNAPTNLIDSAEQPWWFGFYTRATTFDVQAALADPGSPAYRLLLRDIDAIAAELAKLQTADIPVLWRPLHEASGGWFWWGAKGPEPFKKLWRLLYARLVEHHGLHNLVWVLTSQDPDWYPGGDVVDILGVDAYPSSPGDALSSAWEAMKARFDGRKLIALTELGGVPDIERMHQFGIWWSHFVPWTGSLGPPGAPDETVVRIYQSPSVLTLEEHGARPMGRSEILQGDGGGVHLWSRGPRSTIFHVTASEDLHGSAWIPLETNRFTGGVHEFSDRWASLLSRRCYRYERLPR